MKILIVFLIISVLGVKSFSQVTYFGKVETGYLKFQHTTVQVEPGPNWKGYNLDKEQNGIDLNIINGIKLKDKFFIGIGLGYLNFEGINGLSIFTDFEYLILKTKLTPLINLKIGYNHIWNQYKNGTGSALAEFNGGINYKINAKFDVYIQSGLLTTQQALIVPIKLGLRF